MPAPPKLKPGDEIRILALSRSLGAAMQSGGFTEQDIQFAVKHCRIISTNDSATITLL